MKKIASSILFATILLSAVAYSQTPRIDPLSYAEIVNNTSTQLTVTYQTCPYNINDTALCSTRNTVVLPPASTDAANANTIRIPVDYDEVNEKYSQVVIQKLETDRASNQALNAFGMMSIGFRSAAIVNDFGTTKLYVQFAEF